MSNQTYWLSLFNPTTWQEFLDGGAKVMGFPETRKNIVNRIKPGDYLLGYLTGASRWITILEVTSHPYFETSRIWQEALFPCRVNVKVIGSLTPEEGIPILSLSPQMRLFDNLKTLNWGWLVRTAPKELHPEDGELITKAIQAAGQQVTTIASASSEPIEL